MIHLKLRSVVCSTILAAALVPQIAFAQEVELLDVTLAEPVVATPPVVEFQQPVAKPAPTNLVILPPSNSQAQQIINQLPPAPPSRTYRKPSHLPARGGSGDLRFPAPSLGYSAPATQPAFEPAPQPAPQPVPLPRPTKGNQIWNATENFGGVKPDVAATGRRIGNALGIKTIYGVGERGNASEHPFGLALDFMVYKDTRRGDAIANYLMCNAAAENVSYIIWQQRIWHRGDPLGAWHLMSDRGSITANHFDHVHASFSR
jgi:hypothetical protein